MSEQKNTSLEKDHFRLRVIAISASFFVGAALMGVKFYVYHLTHSSAVFSDALESIINVAASAFALGSILLAAVPPDENHPYGHGKVEYFSAGFEGALIILAAVGIFRVGWTHIFHPWELPRLEIGLLILLGASGVNLVLGLGLIRAGKQTQSLTLVADGKHVLTDVYTSAGVLLGLFLVKLTGWYWMDGLIACLVGLNILFSGGNLVRESVSGLMNASEPELLKEICNLLSQNRRMLWIDIHQLRAWRSGNLIHIDFHLILPRDLTLEEAHSESKAAESLIHEHFGKAGVLIHLDPCIAPDCPICSLNLCNLRREDVKKQFLWTQETLTSQGGAGERLNCSEDSSNSAKRFSKPL